jgi:hypothetical protein
VATRGAWTRELLDEHVESFAAAYDGGESVRAVTRFSEEELDPAEREILGQILLERAGEEHGIKELMRRRARERGWFRRTLQRLEELGARGDVSEASALIARVVAEPQPDAGDVQGIVDNLRAERGRAARILDELSRHRNADVRGSVVWAAPQVLGDGGVYLLVGLTRDRDPEVRGAAIEELVALDVEAPRKLIPSLRRRLCSRDVHEPVTAMWTLAELHDRDSFPQIRRIAEAKDLEHPWQRVPAEVVALLLQERGDEILRGIRAHDHERMPWLASGARVLGTDEARDTLEEGARSAPDEACRRACAVELAKLGETA